MTKLVVLLAVSLIMFGCDTWQPPLEVRALYNCSTQANDNIILNKDCVKSEIEYFCLSEPNDYDACKLFYNDLYLRSYVPYNPNDY